MGMVTRISEQKGFDLLVNNFESLIQNIDFQFVIIGEGEPNYRAFLEDMIRKYPDRIAGHFSFSSQLPKLIFAVADVTLIPSRFEPSCLVQMEAMRYGCIPIVRKVGGLADSVVDFSPEKGEGTGFVFDKYDPFSLTIAIVRASELYRQKKEWEKLMKRAMAEDFSCEHSAKEYVKLFELALRFHKDNQ